MIRQAPLRILFTGYAPVHFICFRPLFEFLQTLPDVELHVSGGLRTKTTTGWEYDEMGLYGPFDIRAERILTVDEIQQREFDVLFAANSKLIMPAHAERKIQLFHGISFRNRSVRAKNMGCDHYFMVGPYQQQRFQQLGLLERGDPRVVPVGFMKTDRLLDGSLDRESLLARFGFDGSRPVLLYAPTGLAHNSLETIGEEVIRRLKETDAYDLIVKLHDHPKKPLDWLGRLSRYEDQHFRVARDADVVPLLYLADLLISDASSVTSEYALLDRPMVFLDVPRLIQNAASVADSVVDVDRGRWSGLLATSPESVEQAVSLQLEAPGTLSSLRQRLVRDLFYNPGEATNAAVDWLGEHLLPPSAVVAARSQQMARVRNVKSHENSGT